MAALLPVQFFHSGIGPPVMLPFLNREMDIRHSSKLRQVGDAENLLDTADLSKLFCHLLGCPPADAGIYLVKYQGTNRLIFSQHIFQRQHNPSQFAAGGYFLNRLELLPYVGRHKKTNLIDSVCRRLFFRKTDGKPGSGHIQLP